MTSIRKAKKLLKNSKGLAMTIFLKEESEEDGNVAFICKQDNLTFKRFGVRIDFEDMSFVTIHVMFIPYYRMGKVTIIKPM